MTTKPPMKAAMELTSALFPRIGETGQLVDRFAGTAFNSVYRARAMPKNLSAGFAVRRPSSAISRKLKRCSYAAEQIRAPLARGFQQVAARPEKRHSTDADSQ